jgi:uncharacterized protein (TIGR03492 family)
VKRLLLVTNGHGERSIAARLAAELRARGFHTAHFPLVGAGAGEDGFPIEGPRAAMPSGGLVAMGNVGALLRDVGAGFTGLLRRQIAFVRDEGSRFDALVAVGDAYALSFALMAGRPVFFVGTAKSVYVARYGRVERAILRRARRVFVRDPATAQDLRARGVAAEAPGNVIADLAGGDPPAFPGRAAIGLLPGSRREAYLDAVRLAAVLRELGDAHGLLSVASGLDQATMARLLAEDGWAIAAGAGAVPFTGRSRSARLTAWSGPLGSLLRSSRLAIGQAGTANELAAALGVPVVALSRGDGVREDWYRMRQRKLLGDALAIVPRRPQPAASAVQALLDDPVQLERMALAGPGRLGAPGGAATIADALAADLAAAA